MPNTHDYSIANQGAAAFRTDVNGVLADIQSTNSGTNAPTTNVAYKQWADSTNRLWKVRDNANSAYLIKANLDSDMVVSRSSNYTVVESDFEKLILCDASSGAFTITLPAAATIGEGFEVSFKKSESSNNAVTIDGNASETIDGAPTLGLIGNQEVVTLICDGSNWRVLSRSIMSGRYLLSNQTASNSSAINFTSNTNALFTRYEIELVDVVPATDNVDLHFLVSENNGGVWETGASDYAYSRTQQVSSSATLTKAELTAAPQILVLSGQGNAATESLNGKIEIWNAASTTRHKQIVWNVSYMTAAGNFGLSTGIGAYVNANAINAFRVLMSSGNISSGSLRLHGVVP